MRLDKDICLGGRYNGKVIRRIKYNGHYIYPNTYSKYNVYEVEILKDNTTIYLDATNRINLPQVPFYDFGDGVVNPTVGSTTMLGEVYVTYKYKKAGVYQVRTSDCLYGDSPNNYLVKSVMALMSDLKDASYICRGFAGLTSFENIQVNSLDEITTMEHMFQGCENLETALFATSEFPNLTTTGWMFSHCDNLKTVNFTYSILPNLTNMEFMFVDCNELDTVDFSYCDLSNVSNMNAMFQSCQSVNVNFSHCNLSSMESLIEAFGTLNSVGSVNFSHCDLSRLTTLEQAFERSPVVTVDFSNANLSNVTNLKYAFTESSIKNLNLSGASFGAITDMHLAFGGCPLLEEIDLSMLYTNKVTDILGLFGSCSNLESADLRNFDLTSVESLKEQQMFRDCFKLHTIKLNNCSKNTIKRIINSYDFPTGVHPEGKARKIYCKQSNASGLTAPDGWVFEYTDENEVPNMPEYIPPAYVPGKFEENRDLTEVTKNTVRVTSSDTDLSSMFQSCTSLVSVDATSWDTSNVTNMSNMFSNCWDLTSVDLSSFVTSNVTTMEGMFRTCIDLTSLDLSNFDTSNVTDMSVMFYNCSKLESINLSNFDMTNVTDISLMFYYCQSLHTLKLNNCNNTTISMIINSYDFPTGTITDSEGNIIPRKIYCKQENAAGLTAPDGWQFEYIY